MMDAEFDLLPWTSAVAEKLNRFAAGFPEASIYHHPVWSELLRAVYGGRLFLATVWRQRALSAVAPILELRNPVFGNRVVSLPFSDHCLPLCLSRQDSTVLLKGILNSRELATPALLELRGGYQALPGIACVPSGYLHRTSLSADEAKVFARFDKQSVQRRIQKAQANRKLRVEYRTDAAAMREYYRLHIETRQRLGTVPAPRRYFEQLHTRLIEGARTGFIELVYYRGRLAAGSVLLTAYRTMSYKHSGSDKDLWKYHPNHLMLWNAMQTGCSMGLETFDFGRTGMGSINEGLRKFKMGWGSEEIQLQQIYAGTDPCLRAWTRRILRKAVFWLVPRTPRLVTQAAGELFYGHI